MSTRKSGIMNGIAGLAVLALFAVAIVAGQARAGLDSAMQPPKQLNHTPGIVLTLGVDDIQHLAVLPVIVETLLKLPIQVEVDLQTGRITAIPKAPLAGHR